MNQDELLIARETRRHLEKRPLDVTMTQINVSRGVVYVSGTVRGLKTSPLVDVQHEMETFRSTAARYNRDIRDIIFECRIVPNPKKERHGEHTQGGDQTHTRK